MFSGASNSKQNLPFNLATGNRLTVNQLNYCRDISVAINNPSVWISATGSDTDGCGTETSPFASLAAAFDHLNRIHWSGSATIQVDGDVDLGASPTIAVGNSAAGQARSITIQGANRVSTSYTLASPTTASGDWTPITGGTSLMMITYVVTTPITVTRGDRLGGGLVWNQVNDTTVEVLFRLVVPASAGETVNHVVRSDSLTWSGTLAFNSVHGIEVSFLDVDLTHTSTSGVAIRTSNSSILNIQGSTFTTAGAENLFDGFIFNVLQSQVISATSTRISSTAPDPEVLIRASRLENIYPFVNLKLEISGSYWTLPSGGTREFGELLMRGTAVEGGLILAGESQNTIGNRTTIDGLGTDVPIRTSGPVVLLGSASVMTGGPSLELLNSVSHGFVALSSYVSTNGDSGALVITNSVGTGLRAETSDVNLPGNFPLTVTTAAIGIDARDGSRVVVPITSSITATLDVVTTGAGGSTAFAGAKSSHPLAGPDIDGSVVYEV